MKKHLKKTKLLLALYILFFIFFSFIFLAKNSLAADKTCDALYPGDGTCVSECQEGFSPDDTAGLCTGSLKCCHKYAATPEVALEVPIFNFTTVKGGLPEYISTVFQYALYVIVPIAIIMVMVGGVKWILAGGENQGIKEAKKYISGAVIGLIIAILGAFVLNLVGIQQLTMPQLEYIEPDRGATLIFDGAAHLAPSSLTQPYNNKPCPTTGQTQLDVVFTNYYTPTWMDPGLFSVSKLGPELAFYCNVAMQCSCPGGPSGRDTSKSCQLSGFSGGYHPCFPFTQGAKYCTSTASNKTPGAGDIAASTCFKIGCQITIDGKQYTVQDRGSGIKGLHMDFYAGSGSTALHSTPINGKKTITVEPTSCYGGNGGPGGGPGCASANCTQSEAETLLRAAGIGVTSSGGCSDPTNSSCTSLTNMPSTVIQGLIKLKNDTGCSFNVTGGTEVGHQSHGQGLPKVDITQNDCLVSALQNPSAHGIKQICVTAAYSRLSYNCGSYRETSAHFHLGF